MELLRSYITGENPLITKETLNTAMKNSSYSNKKIKDAIAFKFIPIKESVKKYAEWFLRKNQSN